MNKRAKDPPHAKTNIHTNMLRTRTHLALPISFPLESSRVGKVSVRWERKGTGPRKNSIGLSEINRLLIGRSPRRGFSPDQSRGRSPRQDGICPVWLGSTVGQWFHLNQSSHQPAHTQTHTNTHTEPQRDIDRVLLHSPPPRHSQTNLGGV